MPRRYPDLVLDPEKLAAYHAMGADIDLVAGNKGDTEAKVVIKTDRHRRHRRGRSAAARLHRQADRRTGAGDKPFFLEHAFMKVHTDNFPSKEFTGASASKYPYKDSMVEVDAIIGDIVAGARRGGRAGEHLHLRHL